MKAAFLLFLLCVAEADDIRWEVKAMFKQMNSSLVERLSSLEGHNADMAAKIEELQRQMEELQKHKGTVHGGPSAELQLVRVLTGTRTSECGIGWSSYNGSCYNYTPSKLTWNDAEKNCQSQGVHLVSIHSKEEHTFIQALIGNFDPSQAHTWIGLNDFYIEGRWMWSDESKVNYTVWDSGEPNGGTGENCVITYKGNQMYDDPCSYTYPSVCVLRTETRPC